MVEDVVQRLGMPIMRANPFSLRPIEATDAERLVGRRNILREWSEHIRSGSPRLIALLGERGSGRTSLLQAAATWTPESHHAHIWPESDRAATVLTEMYVTFADFDAPRSTQLLGDRLVQTLGSREGPLPLLCFDHPSAPGADHGALFLTLLPILHRLRALTIVTVTPAQYSSWPAEARMAFDATPPLPPFTPAEVRRLIEDGFRSVSTNGWQPDRGFVDHLIRLTGGQPGPLVRLLRDLVDAARGVRDSPVEMLLDLERPHDPVSAAFETAGATTLPRLPRSHPASMMSPEALAAGMADIDRMADDLVVDVVDHPVDDPWEPVDVPARSISRGRPREGREDARAVSGPHHPHGGRPGPGVDGGDDRDHGHRSHLGGGPGSDPSDVADGQMAGPGRGNPLDPSPGSAADGSIVIDRGEGTWGADAFPDDDSSPIYLEDEGGVDPEVAFSPFAEWPAADAADDPRDEGDPSTDGDSTTGRVGGDHGTRHDDDHLGSERPEGREWGDDEALSDAEGGDPTADIHGGGMPLGNDEEPRPSHPPMRGGTFSALTDRNRRYMSGPPSVEPARTDDQRRTRTRIRPQGPIQAKPSEDMGADVDSQPIHVFDGGALWVDPRIEDPFGNEMAADAGQPTPSGPFRIPGSPPIGDPLPVPDGNVMRDEVDPPTTTDDPEERRGGRPSKVYRSEDGTTFLEIEEGCEPPSGFEPEAAAAARIPGGGDGEASPPTEAEDEPFDGIGSLDDDAWDDDDPDDRPPSLAESSAAGPPSPTGGGDQGFGALRERLQGMRQPRWEEDRTLDPLRLRALTANEIIVLEAAATREISPSDSRLQARLQVGRSRLSQIYNGLNRAGILSARKEGRIRFFRLSPQAVEHLEAGA